MDFGWLWCVLVESAVVTNVPLCELAGDVDNGGNCICVGWRSVGEISILSPQFCCEPSAGLKKIVLLKKKKLYAQCS